MFTGATTYNKSALVNGSNFIASNSPTSANSTLNKTLTSSNKASIYNTILPKSRNSEIALSAFAFLFSEMLQYSQKNVNGVQDLEKKLADFGGRVGFRILELITYRERPGKRDVKILSMLTFIHSQVWKFIFGRAAHSLEKSTESQDEYMISDNELPLFKFISVPKELSSFNSGAFLAGIVEVILESSGFPSKVTAHSVPVENFPLRTTLLIKFSPSGTVTAFVLFYFYSFLS